MPVADRNRRISLLINTIFFADYWRGARRHRIFFRPLVGQTIVNEGRSVQEIHRLVGQIVVMFRLLECAQCAITVTNWLEQEKIPYQILQLKTKRRSDMFILSSRLSSGESITENGLHYGVEVLGKVFDNLSSMGLSRDEWVRDFRCRSGSFIIEEHDRL
jgi:Papain fold toxin 2